MEWHKPPFKLRELKIEVTYNCPLICIHCSSDSAPNVKIEIEENKCLEIINEAIKIGVSEIAFSGGEPLNYKPLLKCIEKTSVSGLSSVVYTSGNTDSFASVISDLKNCGLNKVVFSLYSANEKIHQRITRRANSFNNTIQAIQHSLKIDLDTELHFVALKTNLSELSKVINLADKLGLKRISVLRFVPQGRGSINSQELLEQHDYLNLKNEIEKLREKGFEIRTGSPFNFLHLNNQPACNSAIDRLIINPHLDIFPCDAFKQISAKELVGTNEYSNLKKNSLIDCWNKSPFLNEVRKYLTTDFSESCKQCNMLETCLSGCLAQKVLKHGEFLKTNDPNCIIN